MQRLIPDKHCPHCGELLPDPKPRTCPRCMGSLQQRFLRFGCLSSAPLVLGAGTIAWWVARGMLDGWA